ncbi:MAG: antibiotic biosynthesis monooxygenase [Spirochaetales bacterium]|nr:antibiotic biosynthesis monooxygenase [Spirochaetales bacterium]
MHTATMRYSVKKEHLEEFTTIWNERVLKIALDQPGFVRMQLLIRDEGEALAMGTWTNANHAADFMATGVFRDLMTECQKMLTTAPQPTIWTLAGFAAR